MADDYAPDPQEQAALIKALRDANMPSQQEIWERDVTHEEFYYLLGRYPYLELCNMDDPEATDTPVRLHKAQSGWLIHCYDNILCSASMELPITEIRRLYKSLLGETVSATQLAKDEETGEGGRGTLQAQIIKTAYEMVQIAYDQWQNVKIVGGFYGMKRAAWVAAKRFGKVLEGFNPTAEDKVVLYWASKLTPNVGMEFKPKRLGTR